MEEEELSPSTLGTKEHWDSVYTEEYSNYIDHGDYGEVWFGESTVKRIINWLQVSFNHKIMEISQCNVLDIGCGNGMLLLQLKKLGFKTVIGIDYSENAVKLATKIVHEVDESITVEVGNVLELRESSTLALSCTYDVCTDKGTYDAISLDPVDSKTKRQTYIENVAKILSPTGLLIITSCNWTKDELITQFSKEFALLDEIAMPRFEFGGKVGQKVTSLVLKRKHDNL